MPNNKKKYFLLTGIATEVSKNGLLLTGTAIEDGSEILPIVGSVHIS